MTALASGKIAPDFSLPAMDGGEFSLREVLARGPVVVAFFKISCPVCQYALPMLERIYKAHGNRSVTFVGISQNDEKETATFMKQYGVTFPMLLDDTDTFPVSNAYGITNVPTVFWIAQNGEIEVSSVGWSRQDIEDIKRKAEGVTGELPLPLFEPDEHVADFRAG
jgi:peroxiredoxin